MLQLGFDPHSTELIMSCVSSVTYFFLVNGEVIGYIAPTRGIRQGDPLSPYLFILCAEGLTSLFTRYERLGFIHEVSICREATNISHLLFADDNFLFMRASFKECWFLKQILHHYEDASGQCINFQKCAVSFLPNIRQEIQDQLAVYVGAMRVDVHDCYLGLPIVLGRNHSERFSYIKDHLWEKLK